MKFPPWTNVSEAARLLKEGEVVAIPTETVYGLAGNAYNPDALAKIFAAKERPTFDPLIVHIADIAELENVARDSPDTAYRLAEAFWPGPMTMSLPKKDCIPDLCTSGLPSVAVRFPSHPVAQAIIKESGLPLAAPSANLFKHVSPTTAEHVAAQLADRIAGIVDGGPCSVGVESSIISLAGDAPTVLRPGAITPEMFSKVIGQSSSPVHSSARPSLRRMLRLQASPSMTALSARQRGFQAAIPHVANSLLSLSAISSSMKRMVGASGA